MMGELRAAVVGAGSMGRNHVRVLGELEGVRPVVAVDPHPLTDPLDVEVVSDFAEITGRIDFAVLAAPSALHEQLGVRLAALGIPTLIEKPVATSTPSARRLVRAYAEAGVAAAAGHIERFNPVVRALRALLLDDPIGQMVRASTTRIGPFPNRPMPVGVVSDLLVHDIDLACFLVDAAFVSVTATTRTLPGRPCEDDARVRATLTHPDGHTIELQQHASRLSSERIRGLVLTGERGRLVADLFAQTLVLHRDGVIEQSIPITRGQPLAGELEAWCDVVRSGRPDPALATLADGARAVRVAEAILDSASAGEPVTLETAA